MCALGAAHMDIERGRSDSPDERVTDPQHQQGQLEPRELAGEWRIRPGRCWAPGHSRLYRLLSGL